MTSQLNPEAAVFIPVSPTKLLMMDEAIISASPGVEYEESATNLEYAGGPKHVDYFMRDNFSNIGSNSNEFNVLPTDFIKKTSQEHIPFDKLLSVQNITDEDMSGELRKLFIGTTNASVDNATVDNATVDNATVDNASVDNESEDKIHSGDNNTVTNNSVDKVTEDSVVPGTIIPPNVEVSVLLNTENVSPTNNEAELGVRACDLVADTQPSSDNTSPTSEPQKGSAQKKKSRNPKSRNKRRARKIEQNISGNTEEFIIEQRKSPPIELTFKPIQTFSDTNPFGALQTSSTTPTDQAYNLKQLYKSSQEMPNEGKVSNIPGSNECDIMMKTPPSFILRRSPIDKNVVPFEELESPNELPPFVHPPNANRPIVETELPKSPETEVTVEILSDITSGISDTQTDDINKTEFVNFTQDQCINSISNENQEVSFTSEDSQISKTLSNFDLEMDESILEPKDQIIQLQEEHEKPCKIDSNLGSITAHSEDSEDCHTVISKSDEEVILALDTKDEPCKVEIFSSIDSESNTGTSKTDDDFKTNFNESTEDLFADNTNPEMQETSFINDNTNVNKPLLDIKDSEQTLKFNQGKNTDVESEQPEKSVPYNPVIPKTGKQGSPLNKCDDKQCSNIKADSKLMELELETQISSSETTPEELKNLVQGFEVIDKYELFQELTQAEESKKEIKPQEFSLPTHDIKEIVVNLNFPLNETNPLKIRNDFIVDEHFFITETCSTRDGNAPNNDPLNAFDKSSGVSDEKRLTSEDSILLPPAPSHVHSENTKSTFCQIPTPEKEQEITNADICSVVNDQNSSDLEEIVVVTDPVQITTMVEVEKEAACAPMDTSSFDLESSQSNPVPSMMVTEELITSLKETNEVPLTGYTEVPSITRSTPITLFPLPEDSNRPQDLPETDTLISATGGETETNDSVAEKEMKKEKEPVKAKKPVENAAKRPSDTVAKQSTKPATSATAAKTLAVKTSVPKSASEAKKTTSTTTPGKTATTKPATSSALKIGASGSVSTKPSSSSVATSKPVASSVAASKPATSSAVFSKPAGSNITTSKSTLSSMPSSKPAASTTVPSKLTSSNVSSLKSTASIVTPAKSAVSSVTSSKTNTTSVAPSKSVSAVMTSKTATTSPSKPVAPSATQSKSGTTNVVPTKAAASSKTATSNMNTSKSVISSTAPVKPSVSSSTIPAKSSDINMTAVKPTAVSTSVKKPISTTPRKLTEDNTTTSPVLKSTVNNNDSLKPVPNLLSISETTSTVLKSPNKPLTSMSHPTSPTTPTSPTMKSGNLKSPPRSEMKTPLPVKTQPAASTKTVKDTSTDKKPTTNSDVKLLGKKSEVPKNISIATTKTSTPTKPISSGAKAVGLATKAQTSTTSKTAVPKPATTPATKLKSGENSDESSNLTACAGPKKLTSSTVTKIAEKTGKESGKLPANGKNVAGKTTINVKTDPKGSTKNGEKPVLSKKVEEEKKEERSVQVQEHKVSTTNEFANQTNDQKSQPNHLAPEAVN